MPSLRLFNSATRSLEEFAPERPDNVKIYTCGPTVYSAPHIGNFAAYIYWDLLLRVLRENGHGFTRVLNLTDVGHLTSDADSGEDKLEKGAKREGKTPWEVADFYINVFQHEFKKLRLLPPSVWARATDYIDESKSLVEQLIKNGFTYETSDGIYFDTSKFPNYADFARLDLDHLKAGARVEFSSEKKNPSDFAVWKFIKPDELHAMRWDFLGRPGYPGWHLECSAIIHATLGEPIDLHAGGVDHIPVHHTNEIAQTFGAFHSPLSRFWLHCNFLKIDGEKISKSLGNIITLTDLETQGFSVFDFKLWLYQGHYRSERNFTFSDLASAKIRRLSWRNKVALLYQRPLLEKNRSAGETSEKTDKNSTPETAKTSATSGAFRKKILASLNSDLNSAETFALIDAHADALTLSDWQFLDRLFALDLIPEDLTEKLADTISARNLAREKKDFALADKIRGDLERSGISLLDSPDGTFWQLSR